MQTSVTSNILKISFRFVLSFIFSRCIILTLADLCFPRSLSFSLSLSEKTEGHNFIESLIIFVFIYITFHIKFKNDKNYTERTDELNLCVYIYIHIYKNYSCNLKLFTIGTC